MLPALTAATEYKSVYCRLTDKAQEEELLPQLPPQGQPERELAAERVAQAPRGRRPRRVERVGQRLRLRNSNRIRVDTRLKSQVCRRIYDTRFF